MVDLLDANILIGVFRPDIEGHAQVKAWLEGALAQQQAISFPALVELAFLRVVTHSTIFCEPLRMKKEASFLESIHASGCFQPAPWTPRIPRADAAAGHRAEAVRERSERCIPCGYRRDNELAVGELRPRLCPLSDAAVDQSARTLIPNRILSSLANGCGL